MDVIGDANLDEAALILGMITYVGCDGKKKRYTMVREDLEKLYPILKQIMEGKE